MKEYVKIKLYGGGGYVQPLEKIAEAIVNELNGVPFGESITLKLALLEMDESQYEMLPEFMGH